MQYQKENIMKLSNLAAGLCLAAALALPALAAESGGATAFPAYSIELEVDPEQGTISGLVSVELPMSAGAQCIRLPLNLNESENPRQFPGLAQNGPDGAALSSAKVSGLVVDGAAIPVDYARPRNPELATFSLDDVNIALPAGARSVAFRYEARLPKQAGWDETTLGDLFQSRFYWLPQVVDASNGGNISNAAFTYRAAVRLAGKPAKRLDRDGQSRWQLVRTGTDFAATGPSAWTVASDKPVFSFPLLLVRDYRRLDMDLPTGPDGATQTLSVYCRPENEDIGRMAQSVAAESLTGFTKRYYPTDYRYVSLVQGRAGIAGGMCADGVVVIGDGLFAGLNRTVQGTLYNQFVFVVMHEIGHFWFGVGAMPDFLTENYLSEGLNEIATLDLFQERYGDWHNTQTPSRDPLVLLQNYLQGYIFGDSFRSQKDYSVAGMRRYGWDGGLSATAGEKIASAQQAMDYQKSTFVLLMLMDIVGRGAMADTLRTWLQDTRYQPASTEAFRASLEKASGKDLKPFFDAFVYGAKTLDYELGGSLNAAATGADGATAYRHTLTLRDLGDSGLAIPSTIRLFLKDGGVRDLAIDGPGEYTVDTDVPARYAGVDVGGSLLDSARKNNYWPRQVRLYGVGNEPWLGEYGQDILAVAPLGSIDSLLAGSSTGIGLVLTDRASYQYGIGIQGGANLNGGAYLASYGLSLGMGWKLPAGLDLGLSANYDLVSFSSAGSFGLSNSIGYTGLSLGQTWRPDIDFGYVMRTQPAAFRWSIQAGIGNLALDGSSDPFLSTGASLSADLHLLSGTVASLDWQLLGLMKAGTFGNRLGLTVDQLIPFLNHTVLGVELGGAAILGDTAGFQNSNEVLGTALVPPAGEKRYEARGRALLAVQGFNGIELNLFSLATLQSLNFGLCYAVATAFDDEAGFGANLQQAVGLEFLPTVRLTGDTVMTLPLGVSCNITRAIANPTNLGAWEFGYYLDISSLATLAAGALAY
jgi:hypothetical protein